MARSSRDDIILKAHEAMKATSPNFYNLNRPVALVSDLVLE